MRGWALLGLVLWPLSPCARPLLWQVDPVHSRVAIAVDHAGFSRSLAVMSVSSGQLLWDGGDPAAARVEVVLEPGRLDFGDSRWNQAIHGRQLLDVARFPHATFRSRSVLPQPDGGLLVEGELTLRDVTAPVTLQARFNGQRRHPMPPFRQTLGFSATARLSRTAFGADAWQGMVGDSVEIRIELEASHPRRPGEAPSAGEPTPEPAPGTD